MVEPVIYQSRDNIALIILNSPPVNGLSKALREGIQSAYRKAISDEQIEAMLIASATSVFCGGADIAEFSNGKFDVAPYLPDLLKEMEASTKLIVAAIGGVALGGGLELALACDYRIALPSAKFGLPEVKLGIIPGAGGTQRLPRFSGPKLALEMIVSGEPVTAEKALQGGFIDAIHDSDQALLEGAIAYTQQLLETGAALRNCAEMTVDCENLPENFFNDFRASIARKTRGFFAPERCIQAVEAACALPLADGLKEEAELFKDCRATPQARAQQHLFFAERAANKVPGVDPKTPGRNVRKVAVIGSGTMGGGIAMNFVNVGIETVILDLSSDALERGVGVIRTNYEISVVNGRLTTEQVEQRMALLRPTTDYADIADVDLVIEAVAEKMKTKQAVFKTLDEICKPGAILATSTSTLDVNKIGALTSRPEDVIGLHFFTPPNVIQLLEVVPGAKTATDVIVTTMKIAKRTGKVPVVVGVCFGFVGNRMLEPYGREASRLILEGATPAQIDKVLTDFGMAMGYCSMIDLAGIDMGYLTRQANLEALSSDSQYMIVSDKLSHQGSYGQKTGKGFYSYEGRNKRDNPQVIELARQTAAELGIEQRDICDQEILERMLFTLINEGAQVLDDKIASRSSDCDLIFINAYGFPAWRGGPMQYADEIGLDTVLTALKKYNQQLGDYGELWFNPAPLLEKLAMQRKTFKSLNS